MGNYDKVIEEINSKKENIAYAIAMAYADGDPSKFYRYIDRFNNVIMNDEVFFVDSKKYTTGYEKKVIQILDDIKEETGIKIDSCVVEGKKPQIFNVYGYKGQSSFEITGEHEKKVKKVFEKDFDLYVNYGINYECLFRLYLRGYDDGLIYLRKKLKLLDRTLFFRDYKKMFSLFKELKFSNKFSKVGEFFAKYNVKNMDDLLVFNTELDSFLFKNKVNDKVSFEIINKNKENFRRRLNISSVVHIDESDILKIKKKIVEIFNDNFCEEILKNSNIGDFLTKNNYEYSKDNLKKISNIYFENMYCLGVHFSENFGSGEKNYCFYNSSILGNDSEMQNGVILHEFVHSLDSHKLGVFSNGFRGSAKYLDEALTEYIAKEACKYLDGDILSNSGESKENKVIVYDCLLPLVNVLRYSTIWDDMLLAKFENDAGFIKDRVGDVNFKNICKCFYNVFVSDNKKLAIKENCEELEKIMVDIRIQTRHTI